MPEHIKELKKLQKLCWKEIERYVSERDSLGTKVMAEDIADLDFLIRHPFCTNGEEWDSVHELVISFKTRDKIEFPFLAEIISKRV